MAAIGAGLIVVSIPLMSKANKLSISAIDMYNEGLKTTSNRTKPDVHLAFKGNSIGLAWSF